MLKAGDLHIRHNLLIYIPVHIHIYFMTMVGAQKRNPFGDHISSALIILLKSNSADFIILSKIC